MTLSPKKLAQPDVNDLELDSLTVKNYKVEDKDISYLENIEESE